MEKIISYLARHVRFRRIIEFVAAGVVGVFWGILSRSDERRAVNRVLDEIADKPQRYDNSDGEKWEFSAKLLNKNEEE